MALGNTKNLFFNNYASLIMILFRSYFFELGELSKLFTDVGFQVVTNDYVERRTINKKEQIDVPRNFVQGKFKKPSK